MARATGDDEDDAATRVLKASDLPSGFGQSQDDTQTRVLKSGDLAQAGGQDDDDMPTRILQGGGGMAMERQAPVVAPRGTPGDRIVFQCPNGHRIVVGKQFGGKRGKCNKCGANVQIPRASDEPAADPFAALISPPDDGPPAFGLPDAAPADEPPSLEGLPFGDLGAAASSEGEGDEATDEQQEGGDLVDWNFAAAASEKPAAEGHESFHGSPLFDAGSGNPTALLVARLWAERDHGGVIEIHVAGGGVFLPEWYDTNWSRGTHGLFASQAPDGSVTLTAVAWENVEKVIVRQLAAVPDDMFT
jgi:hypothetical protein